MNSFDHDALIDQTVSDIQRLLSDRFGNTNLLDTPRVMGKLLSKHFLDSGSLEQNGIGWAVDYAVADQLSPCIESYLRLHEHLVKKGCTASTPWDLGYADRYVAVYANEDDFKSFAVSTQNFTYMVAITIDKALDRRGLEKGEISYVPIYDLHIRRCCKTQFSIDPILVDFSELDFLEQSETALRNPYFRYGDERDQGYLCSLKKDPISTTEWRCESALSNLAGLEYVTKDLASLVCHSNQDTE